MPDWTEEMDSIMKSMLLDRKSCSMIGAALGRSRNAVIGRAHRLKLNISAMSGHPRGAPRSKKRVIKLYDFSVGVRPMLKAKPPQTSVVRKTTVPIPTDYKCKFAELDGKKCHFPLWPDRGFTAEKFYCGAAIDGKTYCTDHWKVMVQPPRYLRREPLAPFVINRRPINPPKSNVA